MSQDRFSIASNVASQFYRRLCAASTTALAVSVIAACSGGSASAESPVAACFADAVTDPCTLLTEERLRAVIGDVGEITGETFTIARSTSCDYSWSGSRTMKMQVGTMTFENPIDDEASLSIEEFAENAEKAKARFAMAYRPRSAEEQARTAENVSGKAAESVAAEHQDMARDFARSMVSKINYETVNDDDLGDAAAWGGLPKSRSLLVLVGNQSLTINLKRSDDDAEHKSDSIALAKELLKSCGG